MDIFKPELALLWEKDDRYTLAAVTMTPHNGFGGGAAHVGTPPGMVHPPEVVPVTLSMFQRTGMYLPVATPVTHSVGGLGIGGDGGKTGVIAYTVLDGCVVGTSAVDTSAAASHVPVGEGEWSPILGCKDWHAVAVERSGRRRLYVHGAVTFRALGYGAALVQQDIGMYPDLLMCNLAVTPPGDGAPVPLLHDVYVNFELDDLPDAKEKLAIAHDGDPVLEIPIQSID